MLAIRLQRVGRKKQPLYRVVVSEKTKDTYGNHLEILGQYNPHTKEIVLKEDRIKYWLDNGAQASATVHNFFLKQGIIEGQKAKAVAISKKRQAKKAGGLVENLDRSGEEQSRKGGAKKEEPTEEKSSEGADQGGKVEVKESSSAKATDNKESKAEETKPEVKEGKKEEPTEEK